MYTKQGKITVNICFGGTSKWQSWDEWNVLKTFDQ